MVLLPPPPECWGHRCAPSCNSSTFIFHSYLILWSDLLLFSHERLPECTTGLPLCPSQGGTAHFRVTSTLGVKWGLFPSVKGHRKSLPWLCAKGFDSIPDSAGCCPRAKTLQPTLGTRFRQLHQGPQQPALGSPAWLQAQFLKSGRPASQKLTACSSPYMSSRLSLGEHTLCLSFPISKSR
jgi:hypothetical protein